MLSNQVFNIFRKPQNDESIQKVEWRTYYPYVKSFRNNDVIEIDINQSDAYDALYDSLLFISGTVERIKGDGRATFVNNAGDFMFQSATYEQNGKELEAVREVGIVSTVRGFLTYTDEDIKHLAISGWTYPNSFGIIQTTFLTFNILIPVKHFLNIFNDHQCVSYGKHTIRLVRAGDDSNCFKIDETAGTVASKTEVKLNIENIELKVKRIFPHDQIKLQLLKAIQADSPILIPFRKWELHMLPALTQGAKNEIWTVKNSSFL
ncbi:uncharacterized protein [Leptinotarsa decemlineata]|uniref:uncharacterized protein n=1 Tax=Leptinotarsa decemlineata TaxID=7539 RepID=UPI003D3068B0